MSAINRSLIGNSASRDIKIFPTPCAENFSTLSKIFYAIISRMVMISIAPSLELTTFSLRHRSINWNSLYTRCQSNGIFHHQVRAFRLVDFRFPLRFSTDIWSKCSARSQMTPSPVISHALLLLFDRNDENRTFIFSFRSGSWLSDRKVRRWPEEAGANDVRVNRRKFLLNRFSFLAFRWSTDRLSAEYLSMQQSVDLCWMFDQILPINFPNKHN